MYELGDPDIPNIPESTHPNCKCYWIWEDSGDIIGQILPDEDSIEAEESLKYKKWLNCINHLDKGIINENDIERWITVNGSHIPIKKGQSVDDAIKSRFGQSYSQTDKDKIIDSAMKHRINFKNGSLSGDTYSFYKENQDWVKKNFKWNPTAKKWQANDSEKIKNLFDDIDTKWEERTREIKSTEKPSEEQLRLTIKDLYKKKLDVDSVYEEIRDKYNLSDEEAEKIVTDVVHEIKMDEYKLNDNQISMYDTGNYTFQPHIRMGNKIYSLSYPKDWDTMGVDYDVINKIRELTGNDFESLSKKVTLDKEKIDELKKLLEKEEKNDKLDVYDAIPPSKPKITPIGLKWELEDDEEDRFRER